MYCNNMTSLDDEELELFIDNCLPEGMRYRRVSTDEIVVLLRRYESAMHQKSEYLKSPFYKVGEESKDGQIKSTL